MEIRVNPVAERADPVHSRSEGRPKTLKERLFVRIGEFHSGAKRASGKAGGMRDAGAGAKGSSSVVRSPATLAVGALFEV
ncbi:hypothetical protein AYJ54_31470 [Bradyrhizobium centrolobii]|uniref:Uncharacterized protein n=1 Tax=Bradyrhizobium centrolobii TaxID=1505087 RepID=A0A176Y8M1_9BRAD|nr:hypothetical protein AYJ54_31470 [Bradyrhizobium centrolobii]